MREGLVEGLVEGPVEGPAADLAEGLAEGLADVFCNAAQSGGYTVENGRLPTPMPRKV